MGSSDANTDANGKYPISIPRLIPNNSKYWTDPQTMPRYPLSLFFFLLRFYHLMSFVDGVMVMGIQTFDVDFWGGS